MSRERERTTQRRGDQGEENVRQMHVPTRRGWETRVGDAGGKSRPLSAAQAPLTIMRGHKRHFSSNQGALIRQR